MRNIHQDQNVVKNDRFIECTIIRTKRDITTYIVIHFVWYIIWFLQFPFCIVGLLRYSHVTQKVFTEMCLYTNLVQLWHIFSWLNTHLKLVNVKMWHTCDVYVVWLYPSHHWENVGPFDKTYGTWLVELAKWSSMTVR